LGEKPEGKGGLNFKKMKKQILIFAMLTLAVVFAGLNKTFGQTAVNNTDARPVTCVDPANPDPLRPIAGVPYRYETNVTPVGTPGSPGTAHWFVTTDINFITGGALTTNVEAVGDDYLGAAATLGDVSTDDTNNPNPQGIDITWKSEGLSQVDDATNNFLFVGVMYTAPADACANNIQVWKIEPVIAFTLDITNVEFDGTDYTPIAFDTDLPQCFDVVASAVYDHGSTSVLMDYGTQTLFFEIIAANFSTSFDAWFELDGLQTGQTANVYWGYTPATATNQIGTDVSGTWTMTSTDAITATTSESNTSAGVSIYVRVEISNNNFEGLIDTPITLAVDGTDSAGNTDVDSDCNEETAFADEATQTLEARPTIDSEDPASFVPKN